MNMKKKNHSTKQPVTFIVSHTHHIDREGEMVLPPPLLIHTQEHVHLPSLYLTLSLWWISAPLSNSTFTMERCPLAEALRRAVCPYYTT